MTLPSFLTDPTAIVPMSEHVWSSEITPTDRARLHQILRKVHLRHFPAHLLTSTECDKLLDAWGPCVAQTLVKAAVDARIVA
jgi:hypothetical protein